MKEEKVKVPPIKIQGIKTKLIPFIKEHIEIGNKATYYEPFMGSGAVGFNLAPERAVFSDTNPYIINFYNDLKTKKITSKNVREFLEEESVKLAQAQADKSSYYYEVRNRFNKEPNSLDFLFLQRANFNGLMRFNAKGEYNVPFCRKPERFNKSLITKIVNQVKWVEELIDNNAWKFECKTFNEVFKEIKPTDFIYLDPPYIGRNDTYYGTWTEEQALELVKLVKNSNTDFVLSMWLKNKYRENPYMKYWKEYDIFTTEHYYYVGAKESNRNSVVEALVVGKSKQ